MLVLVVVRWGLLDLRVLLGLKVPRAPKDLLVSQVAVATALLDPRALQGLLDPLDPRALTDLQV